jgi:hypothetical protein
MFDQGWQARGQWEQWFNNLPGGDYKTGAFFWASQRSLPNRPVASRFVTP